MSENPIKIQLFELYEELERSKKKYEDDCKLIESEIRQLQSICPHDDVEYVPDASGNNGSYHVCLNCHKEQKRFR